MLRARDEDNMIAGNMDEQDDQDYQNFPDDYKELMKAKLTWQHLKPMSKWLFWIDDDNASKSPQTQYPCAFPSPAPETPMANWRITMKLHSVIRKLLVQIDESSLVQLWVPRVVGDRILLTTADQPFGFTLADKRFCDLRMKLMKLELFVDGKGADNPGIIGHVFKQHMVVSTPNVKYYTSTEYPQREDAIHADILSSIAYPVIEPSEKCCIAVLEVLSTSRNIPTSAVIRAILDVGLRSSSIHGHDFIPEDLESHRKAVDEMQEGVKVVCETHKLPLCQTWFRCMCCCDVESSASCVIFSGGSSNSSYALDDSANDFLSACSANPLVPILLKGQGVAGKALASYTSCFCRDVTGFTIAEYPLVHLARISWLAGSFAICLRSTYTGDADYVLEFFLPQKRNSWDPRPLLGSLLETMKQQFPSFKVASGKTLGEDLPVEYIDVSPTRKGSSQFQIAANSPGPAFQSLIHMIPLEIPNQQRPRLMGEHSAMNDERNVVDQGRNNGVPVSSESNGIGNTIPNVNHATETVVTYEALEQHFGKKLNDVAESLGVGRSTLKRICRKHGIKRWPHRKRSKCLVSEAPQDLGIICSTTANSADEVSVLDRAASTWPEPSNVGIFNETEALNFDDEFERTFSTQQSEDLLSDDHFSRDSEWLPGPLQSEDYQSDDHFSRHSAGLPGTLQSQDYQSDDHLSRVSEWLAGDHLPSFKDWSDVLQLENYLLGSNRLLGEALSNDVVGLKHLEIHRTSTSDTCPDMIAAVKDKGEKIFVVKATYGENTIRFPFSSSGGIIELKNEVAKRLGTSSFKMKYLDDDQEWILMTCDEDVSECFIISSSSGNSSFRLVIIPIAK